MVTYIIIGITVILSYLCFKDTGLFYKLALIPYRVIKNNQWYRVISHGFIHADTTHLLVNMFTYWSFGTYMENVFQNYGFGTVAYLGLYLGGMIFASLYDLFKRYDDPYYISIGASGAVSAILFASILFNPWGKILLFAIIPIPGILFGVVYLAYCQYMAKKAGDNINHNAHFYGAVFGFFYPVTLEPSLFLAFLSRIGL